MGDTPSVQLSFANNFWGKEDAGVSPLLERMHNAKVTGDELKAFYTARAAIEDEYSRKLLNLARKPLGSSEAGTLKLSLDVVRAEIEATGKAHQHVAQQMKSELEEPLAAFAGGNKERRKIVQSGIEKLLKVKNQQTAQVNKARDKYEQDCLKIKGYLAQGHMVMGQEERKNKEKLEKTQVQLSGRSNEYEAAVKILEETTGRWNRDWKSACDKFQDLEEERIDFMKSSLWTFANIASTVCVSDDASCEKVRLSLEDCDVEKDIMSFIKEQGTGQEIPDPPKFIDFCRGDINDNASDTTDDEAYTVAQFPRPINPTIRSSSPQPSMFESHHDPNSALARDMGVPVAPDVDPLRSSQTSSRHSAYPDPRNSLRGNPYQQGGFANSAAAMSAAEIPQVPHDPYPQDGMTQFCRTKPNMAPPSERSSQPSPARPASRDSASPIKQMSMPPMAPPPIALPPVSPGEDDSPKKRGFFNSPFRRRASKHERDTSQASSATATPTNNRNTWGRSAGRSATADVTSSPSRYNNTGSRGSEYVRGQPSASPEPDRADPRASFQLNVGNNVFDVASPDTKRQSPRKAAQAPLDLDPIAQALEELKGVTKQSSIRQSADRYAGLATPAPGTSGTSSPMPTGAIRTPIVNGSHGTPPPSYDQPISRLGAPPAAHTSRAMQESTKKFTAQKQEVFNGIPPHQRHQSQSQQGSWGRQSTRQGPDHRSSSPAPPRATSPRPDMYHQQSQQGSYTRPSSQSHQSRPPSQSGYANRAVSPNPYQQQARPRANTNHSSTYGSLPGQSPTMNIPRALSPQPPPFAQSQSRPGSRAGGPPMAMQLASPSPASEYGTQRGRPQSQYYAGSNTPAGNEVSRVRSKSVAEPKQAFTRDGMPILHYARALYMYQAQIAVELGFSKGDVLAVVRHQDDGWWEAEITGKPNAMRGLVPSNYLQRV
ncbi:hypothetical protein EG328_001503 [Venturia inaequalis]|uniref:Cell division control protein n=1 Tax=Venturia inaequalis TaxID=5025 RepID=A0A8H3UX79_VENIN|nr:hypothetical protein EG328_001503 [Venturia inaequalis]